MIFLLILLLPSQLAYHFWPSWSLVYGIRVDYLSPTLYLTDLIILGLFLTSRLRVRVPLFIIIFSVLNILISSFPLLTIYKWLRLLEYFWLFKYLTLKIAREARQSRFKLSREARSVLRDKLKILNSPSYGQALWLGVNLQYSTPSVASGIG